MARPEKVKQVEEIKEKLDKSVAFLLTNYQGLTVEEINLLRRRMKKENMELKVVKNTLLRRALSEKSQDILNDFSDFLVGPTALAFSYEDPIKLAKLLVDFSRENEALKIKAGFLEGRKVTFEEVKMFAALPSREELLSKLLGILQAPIQNLVFVLHSPTRGLVNILSEIRKKKEAQGG
jgi:large subunit ribosomal protein L10